MIQKLNDGATVSNVKNQKKSDHSNNGQCRETAVKKSNSEFDGIQRLLKQVIVEFAEKNEACYENNIFINKLEELDSLKWVCLIAESDDNFLDKIPALYKSKKQFEEKFQDFYLETKIRPENYLLVTKYLDNSNNNSVCYGGMYLKILLIDSGIFYYSVIQFFQKYKSIQHLKNAVSGFEIYKKEFNKIQN